MNWRDGQAESGQERGEASLDFSEGLIHLRSPGEGGGGRGELD